MISNFNILAFLVILWLLSCKSQVEDISTCRKYYAQGKNEKCFECVDRLIKGDTTPLQTLILYGDCADKKQNVKKALNRFDNELKIHINSIPYFLTFADLFTKDENYSSAYRAYSDFIFRIDSSYNKNKIKYKEALARYNDILTMPCFPCKDTINIEKDIVWLKQRNEKSLPDVPKVINNDSLWLRRAIVSINQHLSIEPLDSAAIVLKLKILVTQSNFKAADSFINQLTAMSFQYDSLTYYKQLVAGKLQK